MRTRFLIRLGALHFFAQGLLAASYPIEVRIMPLQYSLSKVSMTTQELSAPFMHTSHNTIRKYLMAKKVPGWSFPYSRYFNWQHGTVEMESGIIVLSAVEGDGPNEIFATSLPEGRTASTSHFGPHETISEAYDAIKTWMTLHKEKPAGAPWEVYWSDPATTPKGQLHTEIFYPIE